MRCSGRGAVVLGTMWILLQPPTRPRPGGGEQPLRDAPLSEWTRESAYATFEDCDRAHSEKAMELIERYRKETGKKDVSKEPGVAAAASAKCVQASELDAPGSAEGK